MILKKLLLRKISAINSDKSGLKLCNFFSRNGGFEWRNTLLNFQTLVSATSDGRNAFIGTDGFDGTFSCFLACSKKLSPRPSLLLNFLLILRSPKRLNSGPRFAVARKTDE